MNQHSDPTILAAHWQRMVEIGAESGKLSVVGLGVESLQPESLLCLLAWRRLALRSTGMLDPRLVVGGEGELWLMASLIWQSRRDPLAVAGAHHVFYAGPDLATRAAALTVTSPAHAGVRVPSLPVGMAWMLTPVSLPGSGQADVEQLPFLLDESLFTPVSTPVSPSSPFDPIELWAVILLVVALVLAALLL
jgi:hypothetical protein